MASPLRIGLGTRLGLGARGRGILTPGDLANCELWLDARLGLTPGTQLEGPYSDMTTWAKVNCTTTATQITDTADGAPTTHYARSSWLSGTTWTRCREVSVELQAGTLSQAQIADFGGNWSVGFDTATGKVMSVTNANVLEVSDLGSGWWRLRFEPTKIGTITISLATMSGALTNYQGTGTGTLNARNWQARWDGAQQGWADLSGNGRDWTQTAPAYQMGFRPDAGTPALYCDPTYVAKHFTRPYTAAFNTSAATFLVWMRTLGYGTSRCIPAPLRTSSGTECFDWWDSGTELVARTTASISASSGGPTNRTMRALTITSGNTASTTKDKSLTAIQSGTVGAASGVTTTGHYLGTRSDLFTRVYGYVYGVAAFSRVLSTEELRAMARFGSVSFVCT